LQFGPIANRKSQIANPFVLTRTVATRQLIVAVSEAAREFSIRPGMTLGEARALCATVEYEEHDPVRDAKALEALARWMMRFSPVVALPPLPSGERVGVRGKMPSTGSPPQAPPGLFIDLTGCDRFFGSIKWIVDRIRTSLAKMRITASVAIGSTPGMAWALTFSPHVQSHLNDLSVVALRLDPDIVESLHHLGLETIGQLLRLPRELLPARFGPVLSLRLDQLLGHVHEPLAPLEYLAPIRARMDFDGLVESLEAIWIAFKQLIGEIVGQLSRHGRGARQIEIDFYRAYAQTIRTSVRLSRPSRDPVNLFNLIRCAMETVETDEGFLGIQLTVIASERISEEQITLLGGEEFAGEIELSHLIERLCIRLGEHAIAQPQLVESHIPELATADERRFTQMRGWGGEQVNRWGGESPAHLLTSAPAHTTSSVSPCLRGESMHQARVENPCHEKRPLHLRSHPSAILVMVSPSDDQEGRPVSFTHDGDVRRIAQAVGPERIAGQWWQGHLKTRDYFDVEDEAGERFWIFRVRENGKWFLHGEFE